MIINKINATFKVATLSLALALTSCGGDKSEETKTGDGETSAALKQGSAYNMFTNTENKLGIFSLNLREILDKMNLDNQELPPEIAVGYAVAKPFTTSEYLGLNIDKPIYGLITVDAYGEPEFIAYTIEVLDTKKFKSVLGMTGMSSMIQEIDVNGESFSSISENGVSILWDNKDMLAVVSAKGSDTEEFTKSLLSFRGVDGPDSPELTSYFSRSDDMNAIYLMKDLAKMLENNPDTKNMPESYTAMMQEGSSVMSVNFNAGELVMANEISAENFKNSEFNMFNAKSIDPSFNNYMTNDKLVAAGMLSINMEVIASMVSMFGLSENDLAGFKMETGMELVDFLNLASGEFALSFNGMETKSEQIDMSEFADMYSEMTQEQMELVSMTMNNEPMPSIVFTAGIKDSTAVGKMIRIKPIVTSENGYYSNGKDAYMVLKEDKLIVTTSQAAAAFFGSGSTYPAYQLPGDIDGSKNAFGFMNTTKESLPNGFVNMLMENKEGQMAMEYLNQLESITGEFEFDGMKISVKTIDKSKNILEYIVNAVTLGIKQEMQMTEATMETEWDDSEYEGESF